MRVEPLYGHGDVGDPARAVKLSIARAAPFVASATIIAHALDAFAAPVFLLPEVFDMSEPIHSADVPDAFLTELVTACGPSGLNCDPINLIGCWLSESDLTAAARDPAGFAAGFFQIMPDIARDLGFRGDARYTEPRGAFIDAHLALARATQAKDADAIQAAKAQLHALDDKLSSAFTRLSLVGQLATAKRYYQPHAGKMGSPGACYMATFTPAWLAHAADPSFVICSKDGENGAGAISAETSKEWYRENAVLDFDKDGKITSGDLDARVRAKLATARGQELSARIGALGTSAAVGA